MKKRNNPLLSPLSWLYGLGVGLRNFLFNQGVLKQQSYPIPLICVGNITVGGTGKTPHVELLISILREHRRIAVISRGYKRKSRGLREVTLASTADEVGDEPKQIKQKYPEVRFIVDGNRRRAMDYLLALPEVERPEVVLLDDGFQHRYVHPSFSILLIDAQRELHEDELLPLGGLREPATARYRADCIILTKCPHDMRPITLRIMQRNLALYPHQRIFFSRIDYQQPRAVRTLLGEAMPPLPQDAQVIALSGIASPQLFLAHIEEHYTLLDSLIYPDHHHFRPKDFATLIERWRELSQRHLGTPLYIICTEKDAVRLTDSLTELPQELVEHLYYLPIETQILYHPQEFHSMICKAANSLPRSLQTQGRAPLK